MRIVDRRAARGAGDSPAAVALGLFDGVHLGHAAVIGAARDCAREEGLRCAVFTFEGGQKGQKHLLTEEQKHRELAALGVETCYQPPFESFCALSPEDFFSEMLAGEYNAKILVCGENFAFGAKRAGNAALLGRLCEARGMALKVAPMAGYKGQAVSSSRIRAALAEGNMEDVNAMLGRPYEIDYPVRHGRGLGGKLGFPTLNQCFSEDIQPPAYGVYATRTLIDGRAWPSATGWGTRPSVDDGPPSCETFIPGFEGELYGLCPRVRFYKKLAAPRRFASLDELARAVQAWARQAAECAGEED